LDPLSISAESHSCNNSPILLCVIGPNLAGEGKIEPSDLSPYLEMLYGFIEEAFKAYKIRCPVDVAELGLLEGTLILLRWIVSGLSCDLKAFIQLWSLVGTGSGDVCPLCSAHGEAVSIEDSDGHRISFFDVDAESAPPRDYVAIEKLVDDPLTTAQQLRQKGLAGRSVLWFAFNFFLPFLFQLSVLPSRLFLKDRRDTCTAYIRTSLCFVCSHRVVFSCRRLPLGLCLTVLLCLPCFQEGFQVVSNREDFVHSCLDFHH
jgi:hypothetical protein